MKPLSRLAVFVVALTACSKPDPWSACRNLGAPGFSAQAPACDTDACRACVSSLTRVWAARADPSQRTAFRARFMTVSADARDAFAARARPDGTYPLEHCTAGTRPGASCAAYSQYCVDVIARGLISGDTSMAERAQYDLAASKACPSSRASIVASLAAPCDPAVTDARCEGPLCATCTAGRLAAMSVLAPTVDDDATSAQAMSTLVAQTPESVARSIAETLGAPEAPADLETVVVQRALRRYCFSLVERSASPPPYACNAVMNRFLAHDEFRDSSLAWEALARARPSVRSAVLDALMVETSRATELTQPLVAQLRALPHEGTTEAITRAMGLATTSDGVWRGLRELLVHAGVTGAALPPVNRPSTPREIAAPTQAPAAAPRRDAPTIRVAPTFRQQQG